MNKKIISGIGGGIIALVTVVVLSVSGAKKQNAEKLETERILAQKNEPRPVRFEAVNAVPLKQEHSYPGTVKASEESALSFRIGGPLIEVNVLEGRPVKKGDLLMQIDPRDFQDRIQSLEAQLAGATALLQNAHQDYDRIARLFEQKVVPQSDMDSALSARDAADATGKNLKAELQIARHALEDTSLIAPYDGTVSSQLVENHEMINAGQVVLQYQNIQTLEVRVSVPENEIVTRPMNGNQTALVSFPSLPEKAFTARLKEWSSRADPMTRTYAVTFEFQCPEHLRILPGMSARIAWTDNADTQTVLTVPSSALSTDNDGSSMLWVYNEQNGNAEMRAVSIGAQSGASQVVITEGVNEGELIVVSGSRLIHEDLALSSVAAR
jgi:RND family efflux transporter MFP subunit